MANLKISKTLSSAHAVALSALLVGGVLVVGCGSDSTDSPTPAAGSGGKVGQAGQSGGGSGGAAAGSSPGGAGNSGGKAGGLNQGGAAEAGAAGESAAGAPALGEFAVKQTNLDSDQAGKAAVQDPTLLNAWSIAINPTAQVFWISSNHGGVTPVYGADGAIKPVHPTVAPVSGTDPGPVTGQVFNSSTNFMSDKFIIDTEDGQIMGWSAGATFTQRALTATAVYKGLALLGSGATELLLAANFHDGTIDVFDVGYAKVTKAGIFEDSTIPKGFAPFNVVTVGNKVYVAYAKQDADKQDDVSGAGNGYVSEFDADGKYVKTLISGGGLNSPWAITPAPAGFGVPSSALLVGNFGNGAIDAYDAESGALVGELTDETGGPLLIQGLWDLKVGPAGATDLSGTLFFTAGPGGEAHGLFGKLEPAAK